MLSRETYVQAETELQKQNKYLLVYTFRRFFDSSKQFFSSLGPPINHFKIIDWNHLLKNLSLNNFLLYAVLNTLISYEQGVEQGSKWHLPT